MLTSRWPPRDSNLRSAGSSLQAAAPAHSGGHAQQSVDFIGLQVGPRRPAIQRNYVMRMLGVTKFRGCPRSLLPTRSFHLRGCGAGCIVRPRARRQNRKLTAQPTVLFNRVRSCLTSLCVAPCGRTDVSIDGQAEAFQKRHLSCGSWASWPSWRGNTTRRPQKRFCLCGSGDTRVSALGCAATPLRNGVWSSGPPPRQRRPGKLARRPNHQTCALCSIEA